MNQPNRGILTMAYGERKKYVMMAKGLAQSLILHSPNIRRAIVTDSRDSELNKLYHIVIPLNPEWGQGMWQKLYINEYSPFAETIYIDSDCLVVKPIDSLWDLFAGVTFGVIGKQISTGQSFGGKIKDVQKIRDNFNLNSIPVFNGGLYFFEKKLATPVFLKAREIANNYAQLGIGNFQGGLSDETVFSIALAGQGINAISDPLGLTMRTLRGISGPLKIDVLQGYCSFIKDAKPVEPAIVHFAGYIGYFYQIREMTKLKSVAKFKFVNYQLMSHLMNLIFYFIRKISRIYKFTKNVRSKNQTKST